MGRRVLLALLAMVVAALALGVTPAFATFHLMQIREIYPGSAAHPESEYVELQMWAAGQNHVEGHVLRSYGGSGSVLAASVFPADVADGANQSTLVLATPQAEAEFGFLADGPLSPPGQLSPSAGAVCWEAIDCVSWGSFSGALPSPSGSPASPAGIPDGMALRRSITAGCATALDPEDDHDNSAADFAPVFPDPRPNSVPPAEQLCAGGPGGGSGGSGSPAGSGRGAPQSFLLSKPSKRTRDRTPSFRFGADEADVRFQCKVDSRPFRGCRSPFTTRRLAFGFHTFKVRAVDSGGRIDPTPASYRFKLVNGRG